jgi:hypothetical protein
MLSTLNNLSFGQKLKIKLPEYLDIKKEQDDLKAFLSTKAQVGEDFTLEAYSNKKGNYLAYLSGTEYSDLKSLAKDAYFDWDDHENCGSLSYMLNKSSTIGKAFFFKLLCPAFMHDVPKIELKNSIKDGLDKGLFTVETVEKEVKLNLKG